MSAQSPWRPAQQRASSESPKVIDELESPPRRWPMLLVAVVALLIGLGLGNAFGTSGRDLRSTEARLGARTSELQNAQEALEKVESDYDRTRTGLTSEARAHAITEEGLEALAREAALLAGHPVPPAAGGGEAGTILRDWVDGYHSGDLQALTAAYTPEATITAVQSGIGLLHEEGARAVVRAVRIALPGDLRLTTPVVGGGQFAVAGYVVSGSTGVMVVRVVDGRITQQWLYLDGRF